MTVYSARDGDTSEGVAQQGAVRMRDTVGFCELCNCYRDSSTWQMMYSHGTPYAACSKHTPLEIEVWDVSH